jgi:hypothetical protein
MAKTTILWEWVDAFDKFGFGDGDGANFTDDVAAFINSKGYECDCETWGIHNYMIKDITAHDPETDECGASIMTYPEGHPKFGEEVKYGYDNPREWLPKWLVEKLDKEFGEDNE